MKVIASNFATYQINPSGDAREHSVNPDAVVDASSLPECEVCHYAAFHFRYGSDIDQNEAEFAGRSVLLLAEKSEKLDKLIKIAEGKGQLVVHVEPSSVKEKTIYFTDYSQDLWVMVGDADPVMVEKPKAKTKAKTKKPKKRARNSDGEFKADDPSTPEVNEAFESGES